MNKNWTIQYWHEENKASCVETWLDLRTLQQLKSIVKELKLLEYCGNQLRLPHSKALGEGLFELRERIYGYRIYFSFLPKNNIVLLHAGDKSSQKKDIAVSRTKLLQLQQREGGK